MAFNDDFAAAAAPDLLYVHGEAVTHRPLGQAGDDREVTAIVEWEETAENPDGGRGQKVRGMLDVASSVTVNERDQWLVAGVLYQALRIDPPQGGLQRVHLQRITTEHRTRAREVL